jgi:hypothetical protein
LTADAVDPVALLFSFLCGGLGVVELAVTRGGAFPMGLLLPWRPVEAVVVTEPAVLP